MKKELLLFSIDGSCCGNQDKMVNPWMNLGGCAALAAVDTCLLLTLHNGFSGICPIDPFTLNWESYNHFAEALRPYLSPRMMGVNRLCYYTDGFGAYLRDIGCSSLSMEAFPMGTPTEDACHHVKKQIDSGFPVPILHLNAKTRSVKEYQWHWFLLTGYAEEDSDFTVKAVTYGESEWLRLADLWHENDSENGGLILYSQNAPAVPYEVVKKAAVIICDRPVCPNKVLAGYGSDTSALSFPSTALTPGENAETALVRELADSQKLSVHIVDLLAIHEYDAPPLHISERCYKAVLTDGFESFVPESGGLFPLSEEELDSAKWHPCDEALINIIRSDMTDVEVIRKRIAEEEAQRE